MRSEKRQKLIIEIIQKKLYLLWRPELEKEWNKYKTLPTKNQQD